MSAIAAPVARASVEYHVLGVRVRLASDDPWLLERVDDTYGPFRGEVAATPAAPLVEVDVREGLDGLEVWRGGALAYRPRDIANGLIAVFDALSAGIIGELSRQGRTVLHAGTVERHGRAVLLAGRSGGGKTTTVLELLRRGARLMSDELAIIDTDVRTVHAYPRGFHIRPATATLIPELAFLEDLPRHEVGGGSEWSVSPQRLTGLFGTAVTDLAPLGAILLLDGIPDGTRQPSIRAVPGALASVELLASAPAAAVDYAATLRSLTAIVNGIPCARLLAGDLRSTGAAVDAWLESLQ